LPTHLEERLARPGPKRILSLDGGGVRGLITLSYLERIEAILRVRTGRDDLVLADYFDLIGGTSTGAVIASGLSLGWSARRLHALYQKLGRDIFQPRRSALGPLTRLVGSKFSEKPLERLLRAEIGEMRLDSEQLRTGLVIVAKRADTASVWQLTNIPFHKFYEHNRHLLLWEVIRASSAAPTYFSPQRIGDVGGGEEALFVDGGVSMHVDPALQMLMVASLDGFGLRWPFGEDRLMICSVGTGWFDALPPKEGITGFRQLKWLGLLTVQMMRDASELGQTMLQWMSRSPTAAEIDLQIGDLAKDNLAPTPLLHYLRYNVGLQQDDLKAIGLDFTPAQVQEIRNMADPSHVDELDHVGEAAARAQVRAEHFPPIFDLASADIGPPPE
jgi:hypothetical protein